jgi:predicted nucleotidyltransferase component of viral defense system
MKGKEFQYILTRFGIERFLYRLGESPHRNRFILKGAQLLHTWVSDGFRPSLDLDLLHPEPSDIGTLVSAFQDICGVQVEPDGITFDIALIHGDVIRTRQQFQGCRIKLMGDLDGARIPLQVDVGFGDVVVPDFVSEKYRTLLDQPAPDILVYSIEKVLAEKLHAIVVLGMLNTRLKDYFDVWFITSRFSIQGIKLCRATLETFKQRDRVVPGYLPPGLSDEFGDDAIKQRRWGEMVSRAEISEDSLSLLTAIETARGFYGPLIEALADDRILQRNWEPGKGWK